MRRFARPSVIARRLAYAGTDIGTYHDSPNAWSADRGMENLNGESPEEHRPNCMAWAPARRLKSHEPVVRVFLKSCEDREEARNVLFPGSARPLPSHSFRKTLIHSVALPK